MNSLTTTPFLSVIIPVYNEHQRIRKIIKIDRYLKLQPYTSEIIIVNDGSNDNTLQIISKFPKSINHKIISYEQNQGKGYAIKIGMLKAKGLYRLFMDVDLSTPIEEFEKFLPLLKKHTVIIATRKTNNSVLIKHQPKPRELLGKAFTGLARFILDVQVSDFTCGFKCFHKKAAYDIFSRSTINRWSFDPEILYIAKLMKYHIHEIPVIWKNDPSSKVKFPHDLIRSFNDLLTIKLNYHKGIYS